MSLGRRGMPRASWCLALVLLVRGRRGRSRRGHGRRGDGGHHRSQGEPTTPRPRSRARSRRVTSLSPRPASRRSLSTYGYEEKEYFASGTASAFKAKSEPSDGKWSSRPTTTASYRTRIIVRRPADAAKFNGTVVVEWMNVSAGESAPGLGLPQSRTDAGGLCLRRGVGPGPRRRWWHVPSSASVKGRTQRRADRERAGPLRDAPSPRRPVRPRYVRPDRQRPPGRQERGRCAASTPRTTWRSGNRSRPST